MSVQVYIPTPFRRATGGRDRVSVDATDVRDLVERLEAEYAGLRGLVRDEGGAIHAHVNVYVNNEEIDALGGLDTPSAASAAHHDRERLLDIAERLLPIADAARVALGLIQRGPLPPAARSAPPGDARIVVDRAERIEVEVDSPAGGFLVLRRAYLPIWRAEIDGRPARPGQDDSAIMQGGEPPDRPRPVRPSTGRVRGRRGSAAARTG